MNEAGNSTLPDKTNSPEPGAVISRAKP